MYPILPAVKALFDAEQAQVLRVSGTDKNGTTVSITDADVVIDSFNIDRYSCVGEKLEVGTAVASEMTLTLDNHDGRFGNIVFEGTELFVEIGVADWSQSSPTVNWVPCGYFTPDEQPRRMNNIRLNCLDRMTKFDIVINAASLTFPTTVAGLVGQMCTLCGVTLAASISGLPNAGVNIAALPDVNGDITYRNLIQWCAGIMATNAWMDWDGLLRFTWYNGISTGYTTTVSNRFDSDYYEDDLTVTGVVYTNSSGVEIVQGTDEYAIDLTGNALVGPLVSTVLPTLNTALNGFTYRPFTASVINAPYLWPMDAVTFTDKDGNDHASALTNVNFGVNGTTGLESKGLTAALNARKQPVGVTKDQAQLISEAMEKVETDIDESLTQQEIFNRLTDNGTAQGLVLYNGQLYVNASYIQSGTLKLGGLNNENGTFELLDASGNVIIRGSNAGFSLTNLGEIFSTKVGQYFEYYSRLGDGRIDLMAGNSYRARVGYLDDLPDPAVRINCRESGGGLSIEGPNFQRQGATNYPLISLEPNGSIVIRYHDLQLLPYFSDSSLYLSQPLGIGNGGTGATTAAAALTNLGALAAANVYNGLDKTASGFALDARQGKTLNDTMTMIGNGAFNLGSVAANSSKVLKSTQSAHAMLILSGPSVNLFGLYLIRIGTSGTPNTVTITQGSSITFTPASGKITIGNTSTNSVVVNVIPLSGDSSQFSLT